MSTGIQWTDETWNPLRARHLETGTEGWACVRVSPGCVNCYAATLNESKRWNRGTGEDYTVPGLSRVETYLDERTLTQPLRWSKPRRVFVCSMTDLFGEWVTDEQISDIFDVMAVASQHTFQVLTKRPERMRALLRSWDGYRGAPNVWLGVSAEDQERADERIPLLLDTPAVVRFVSAEPLLGPIHFGKRHLPIIPVGWPTLNWVIVGGESGPKARRFDLTWAYSILRQCRDAGVAPFIKQLGSKPTSVPVGYRIKHNHGGDWSEWPEDLRVREWPEAAR